MIFSIFYLCSVLDLKITRTCDLVQSAPRLLWAIAISQVCSAQVAVPYSAFFIRMHMRVKAVKITPSGV